MTTSRPGSPVSRLRDHLRSIGFLSGLLLVAAAQTIVAFPEQTSQWLRDRTPGLSNGLILLPEYVFPVNAYSLALLCAVVGGALFVGVRFLTLEAQLDAASPTQDHREPPPRDSRLWGAAVGLASGSVACLLVAMTQTASRPRLEGESFLGWILLNTRGDGVSNTAGWWWTASLLLGIGLFTFMDWMRGRLPKPAGRPWEYLYVAAVTVAAGAYYCVDLLHWRYAIVGDEYAFLHHAEVRLQAKAWAPFNEEGVYGTHPELSSLYQTVFLQLFGDTAFGWRFSSVVAAAAALPAFYLLVRLLLGVRAAVTGTILLAASHYAFAFAHLPYNNNHVLVPVISALALGLLGLRRESALALGLSGMAAGFGFYTFFSARVGIVLLLILLLLYGLPRSRGDFRKILIPTAALLFGFVLVALPIVRNPVRSLELMLDQTTFGYQNEVQVESESWREKALSGDSLNRLRQNVVHSLLAPLTFEAERASTRHFVQGGLLDRVTGGLAILGLAYLMLWGWKRRWALIQVPYLITLASVGFVSNGDYPLITRMLILVPFLVLAALVALEKLWGWVCEWAGASGAVALVSVVVCVAVGLNVHRSLIQVHQDPAPSWDSAVLALAQTSPESTKVYYILQPHYNRDTIQDAMRIYGYRGRFGLIIAAGPERVPTKLREPCLIAVNTFHEKSDELIEKSLSWASQARVWEWRPSENGSGLFIVEVGETGWDRSRLADQMEELTAEYRTSAG